MGDGPGRADCRLRSLIFPRGRPQFSIAHAHSALTEGRAEPWDLSSTPPDCYISTTSTYPNATSNELAIPSGGSIYQHAILQPSQRTGCEQSAASLCTVHIMLQPLTASVFSIVATAANEQTHLIDGLPQAGQIAEHGAVPSVLGTVNYLARASSSQSEVNLVVTAATAGCSPTVTATTSDNSHSWTSTSNTIAGEQRLTILPSDPGFCVFCEYSVTVQANRGCLFTIQSTSSDALVVLEDGHPSAGSVSGGASAYYKFYVTLPSADVEIVLNALSGDPDLYVSTSVHRPNSTAYNFMSVTHGTSRSEVMKVKKEAHGTHAPSHQPSSLTPWHTRTISPAFLSYPHTPYGSLSFLHRLLTTIRS